MNRKYKGLNVYKGASVSLNGIGFDYSGLRRLKLSISMLCILWVSSMAWGEGNTEIQSFSKAKRLLYKQVFPESYQERRFIAGPVLIQKGVSHYPEGIRVISINPGNFALRQNTLFPARTLGVLFLPGEKGILHALAKKEKNLRGANARARSHRHIAI